MSQSDFELRNFSSLLLQEVTAAIIEERTSAFKEVAFTDIVMDYFSDAEETGNTQICTSIQRNKAGNRQRQLNGYGIWDDYETLDLFIADYRGDGDIYTIEKSRMLSNFNLCLKYLKYAQKGDFIHVEESAVESGFLSNFVEFIDKVLRIRIILITDGLAKAEVPDVIDKAGEPSIFFEVWDIQRIYQVWSAQGKREQIEIDLPAQFGHKIEYLTVDQHEENYSAYLLVVPADLLADLYNIYGTRLLEQNVRVYLQNLGKVNKEIRKTILDSPGMFMAYNNGISATATEVIFETNEVGNQYIRSIKGLQIVNGGQTTSSIYYARKKDRANLSNIHVQMKITKVHDDRKMESMVSKISKYANSQNKVSEIDLTSNQPFHMKLEEISRTTWTNSPDNHSQVRWYYERVKGQYKEELNKEHTVARKNSFKIKNPTNQVLRKEEFAKYRNTWKMLPFWVARGSQKNYLQMMSEENTSEPTRVYFKETVCVARIFKSAEDIYGKRPNSMGDLRYLVVPYSIAWLNYYTSGCLNLSEIWETQTLSDELKALLKEILLKVNLFFQTEKPDHFTLISEWAKREECWEKIILNSPTDWGIDFKLIGRNILDGTRQVDQTAVQPELATITGLSVVKWEDIEQLGRERLGFDLVQINVIRNVISRIKKNRPFSEQLIAQALAIIKIYNDQIASKQSESSQEMHTI